MRNSPQGQPLWHLGIQSLVDEKPFQRRLMEVYAGFTEHVDVQIGRIVEEIDQLGYGANTLIL